jgi:hypothetical protein
MALLVQPLNFAFTCNKEPLQWLEQQFYAYDKLSILQPSGLRFYDFHPRKKSNLRKLTETDQLVVLLFLPVSCFKSWTLEFSNTQCNENPVYLLKTITQKNMLLYNTATLCS